ncbi:1112_t:CDS:2 [Gigaspora rosea]|nr:1112_t:CDS:2 [Gigaspora rosea]
MAENIPLNLKNHLKNHYNEFIKEFFEVQRTSSITIFEYRWKCLLEKYNNKHVVNYLQRLYANKDSWAKAFVLKLFTAGMSSTSLIFNSNTTLLELAEKLTTCILEEDKKTEYTLFHASVPKAALVATADTILPNVCRMLCEYLTIEMLKIQEDQIEQSLQYHAAIVVLDELQRYLSINLDNLALFGENQNLTDIIAKSMLDLIDTNKIIEMWGFDFEMEESMMMGWNGSVPYLNVLNQGAIFEAQDINHKTIDEHKLYGEAWSKARAALMVAVRRHDYNFIAILDKYLNDCQEQLSSDSDSEVTSNGTSDSEIEGNLNPEELMNPHKCKSKGQPKGTNRIQRADEPPKKAKHKLHCKICGLSGHNRAAYFEIEMYSAKINIEYRATDLKFR